MTPIPTDADAIFLAAKAILSVEERIAFLDQACAGDTQLRQRVEDLLAKRLEEGSAEARSSNIDATVEQEAGEQRFGPKHAVAPSPTREGPGAVIGAYKLLQEIGTGGMGTVYMAEQERPVRRTVAIKIIKSGMDSRQVIARFEAERQALALMDHNNIARVLDAGTTDSALPYFVMELVRGVPITEYCERNKLGLRQRLQLFIPVCQAIQHAHQKGIIHRDIKPSNVLVTLYDGQPVPKVIDFGVAKATQQKLTERTMFTQIGQMIGTLEYMSPEQAEMTGLDIDTRSDIYSLGVLLYESLTGTTPLARERLKSAAFDEVLRIIREEEPARPSTRLSETLETANEPVKQPDESRPRRFTAILRRELDWIAMKALEKDRARRYDTATALAADVQRFLDNEPVEASPPSATYRMQKFLRRNRAAIATVSAFVILLLVALGVSSWQAVRATLASQEAERQRREADVQRERAEDSLGKEAEASRQAVAALREASRQQEIAAAISRFINEDLLQFSDPFLRMGAPAADVSMQSVLDRAAQEIGRRFADNPVVEAEIRLTIGQSFSSLGQYEKAELQLQRARELRRQQFGPDAPETLLVANELVNNYLLAHQIDRAETQAQPVYDRTSRALGKRHAITLAAKCNLGVLLNEQRKDREAEQVLTELLQVCREELGDKEVLTADVANSLGVMYLRQKKLKNAKELLEEVAETRRELLGATHPSTLKNLMNLGMLYGEQHEFGKARRAIQNVLKQLDPLLGTVHPLTQSVQRNLAWWLMMDRKVADLERLYADVSAEHGKDHEHTLLVSMTLARAYGNEDREFWPQSVKILEATAEACKSKFGDDADVTLEATRELVLAYKLVGKYDLAIPLCRRLYEGYQETLGLAHPKTVSEIGRLCNLQILQNEFDVAIEGAQEYVTRCRDEFGMEHESTAIATRVLAECLWENDPQECERLLAKSLKILGDRLGEEHRAARRIRAKLAKLFITQHRYLEAEPLCRRQLDIATRNNVRGLGLLTAYLALAEVHAGQSKMDDADEALEGACRALGEMTRRPNPQNEKDFREQMERILSHYRTAGMDQLADQWNDRTYGLYGFERNEK